MGSFYVHNRTKPGAQIDKSPVRNALNPFYTTQTKRGCPVFGSSVPGRDRGRRAYKKDAGQTRRRPGRRVRPSLSSYFFGGAFGCRPTPQRSGVFDARGLPPDTPTRSVPCNARGFRRPVRNGRCKPSAPLPGSGERLPDPRGRAHTPCGPGCARASCRNRNRPRGPS